MDGITEVLDWFAISSEKWRERCPCLKLKSNGTEEYPFISVVNLSYDSIKNDARQSFGTSYALALCISSCDVFINIAFHSM